MKVLFVDAEPRVLEAMARVLFELEGEWELAFARTTDEALHALTQKPCDVIVSDLRGPGLDGVALLTRAAQLYPRIVRIVLSGYDDDAAALQLVHVAHQFLAKPCAIETLHRVIARAHDLARLLPDRKLQTLAAQTGSLPCALQVHGQLLELVERPSASVPLAELIAQDPGLTAKLMQLACSGFFNSAAGVVDIPAAVMRLGGPRLTHLAASLGDPPPARPSSMPTVSAVRAAQQRSLAIARLAASLTRLPEDAAAAYLAGLLCDVGQLVFVRSAPERLYVTQAEAAQRGVPSHAAELATWGATHAEVGAFLLGLWGLPFQVVEAVANHHAPERGDGDRFGLTQLVWLAACVVEGEQPSGELLSRFGAEETYRTAQRTFEEAPS
jgi:HD-like signal output (HDOD) protein